MTKKQIAQRARWMAQYENHITVLRPQMAGKIDWHTATFFYNSGADAFSAAHRWMMNHPLEKKPVTPQVEALDGMTVCGFTPPAGYRHRAAAWGSSTCICRCCGADLSKSAHASDCENLPES